MVSMIIARSRQAQYSTEVAGLFPTPDKKGLIGNLTSSLVRVVATSDLGPTSSPEPGVPSSRSCLAAKD